MVDLKLGHVVNHEIGESIAHIERLYDEVMVDDHCNDFDKEVRVGIFLQT